MKPNPTVLIGSPPCRERPTFITGPAIQQRPLSAKTHRRIAALIRKFTHPK